MLTQRRLQELPKDEALRLLASVPIGRIVFTVGGLPTVRPVSHVLDDGDVVIRTHDGSATMTNDGAVVAYQADLIDPDTHAGWSVMVTGVARMVEDPAEIERYAILIESWVTQPGSHVVRIKTDVVSGFEMVDGS